ncbi:MAG: cobalt-precorrin-6A reductase [Paracoccaceae bacterium]
MPHLLILGGTTEASGLARAVPDIVAGQPLRVTLSYAGRVAHPAAQPVPLRVGGFGGSSGLADWLRANSVTHIVDATHPFAAQMSRNAITAAKDTQTPLMALTRAPWQAQPGDRWTHVADMDGAVAALNTPAQRVFLAVGRLHLDRFAAQPQHHYMLRVVDAPDGPLPLPHATPIIARGPFRRADDLALMRAHDIDLVVAKNAGGTGARAKIDAARDLGLPVIMIDRPHIPHRAMATQVDQVLGWLDHGAADPLSDVPPATERGV